MHVNEDETRIHVAKNLEACVGVCLCRTPQRTCMCVCHNMLHNSTHTIFLLHQMNQFLQDFIQQPEEAERRGKNIHQHHHHHLHWRGPAWCLPALDVEVLPQHQVFEGGVPGECRDNSQQISIQACNMNTHITVRLLFSSSA